MTIEQEKPRELPRFDQHLPETIMIPDTQLGIRLVSDADAPFFMELIKDSAAAQFLPWAKGIVDATDVDRLIEQFQSQWDTQIFARYVITNGGIAIGYFGIWPDERKGVFQTGSAVLPEHRGRGIVNQVRGAVCSLLKEEYGATALATYVNPDNRSSLRMIKKAGYRPTEELNRRGHRRFEKPLI